MASLVYSLCAVTSVWCAVLLLLRYRVQRELYALAAASRGTPVQTAYVFLEEPDERGVREEG